MIEAIITGSIALAGIVLGAWIYSRGLKTGTDIVRSCTNEPRIFDLDKTDILPATTEDMDAESLENELSNPPME